jgi:hypothetical protein
MTIKIVGKVPPQLYRTVCSDPECQKILEFDWSDIGFNSTYSGGLRGKSHRGIVCPACGEVLKIKDFEVLT